MATDKMQNGNGLQNDEINTPGMETSGDPPSLPQEDEIIELTELASDETSSISDNPPQDPQAQGDNLAAEIFGEGTASEPASGGLSSGSPFQGGVIYDDEVLEITADDLLDDEALTLAVEETIEALDLKNSEAVVNGALSEATLSEGALDVNDTLDDTFMESLNFDPDFDPGSDSDAGPDSDPEPGLDSEPSAQQMVVADTSQPQGDELDRLLQEMAEEISPEALSPEQTIVLEDVVQMPDGSTGGGDSGLFSPDSDELDDLAAILTESTQPLAATLIPDESAGSSAVIGSQRKEADEVLSLSALDLMEAQDPTIQADGGAKGDLSREWMPSGGQLEAALERVVTRLYAEKIDGMLNQVIERTVSREIQRIKELLKAESDAI